MPATSRLRRSEVLVFADVPRRAHVLASTPCDDAFALEAAVHVAGSSRSVIPSAFFGGIAEQHLL